jgi:hypothetical protein
MKNKMAAMAFFMCLIFVACEKEDDDRVIDENYIPVIKPENFKSGVTNAYFPLEPGMIYTYTAQTSEGLETDVVTILTETKQVAGVNCTVVRDVVSLDGVMIEDTYDWYAQDDEGNVWYFGEDVSNYENGVLQDKDGSFEAGVGEAKPGIVMMASPVLEMPYRQEYCFNIAEDWGKVVAIGLTVTTPYGTFKDCIKTVDWNALEPDAPLEYKYYAPGFGNVKEEAEDGSEVLELISIEE